MTSRDVRATTAGVLFIVATVAALHEYVGSGHLFTDPSRPDEFDPRATEALWTHVDDFLRNISRAAHATQSAR